MAVPRRCLRVAIAPATPCEAKVPTVAGLAALQTEAAARSDGIGHKQLEGRGEMNVVSTTSVRPARPPLGQPILQRVPLGDQSIERPAQLPETVKGTR
jgi:hypothetical protein